MAHFTMSSLDSPLRTKMPGGRLVFKTLISETNRLKRPVVERNCTFAFAASAFKAQISFSVTSLVATAFSFVEAVGSPWAKYSDSGAEMHTKRSCHNFEILRQKDRSC